MAVKNKKYSTSSTKLELFLRFFFVSVYVNTCEQANISILVGVKMEKCF